MKYVDLEFYRGKRVLVTGHTGFKGTWLCRILIGAGAIVTGYALEPATHPNLFALAGLEGKMTSVIGDIRNINLLKSTVQEAEPEIVFHLAAQPIVRKSYKEPATTYEINVMGTVNILECIRTAGHAVRSVVIITTDKVYENKEWAWGYRENDPLDGHDPYSNSKSCAELVTHSYCKSFFDGSCVAVSTVRAGNVIGGGDFSQDRILPDCIRAAQSGKSILVRNPHSIRPYQHVLEPLMAYLMIAQRQYEDHQLSGWYNIGPDECDCVTTKELVELFCQVWGADITWKSYTEIKPPHEASFLKLDCSKLKSVFGWRPQWRIQEAVAKTVGWSKAWMNGENMPVIMDAQIQSIMEKTCDV